MSPALERLYALLFAFAWIGRATAAAVVVPAPGSFLVLLARLLASSLPVVAVVALFSGAMLTVQAVSSLSLVGGGPLSGTIVGLGGVREVFPLLAVAAVAARTGAEFASELGTMRVTQQVDALSVMGLDPMRLLVAPRVLAATVGTPACVLLSNAMGLAGSFAVGSVQLGIDRGSMWGALMAAVQTGDLVVGLAKGVVLGWLVGVITTREGMLASGGPRGVGRATNRAVVRAMVAVCCVSLLATYVVYGRAALGGG